MLADEDKKISKLASPKLLAFIVFLMAMGFLGFRFSDWRVNEMCGSVIYLLFPVSLISMVLSFPNKLIKYIVVPIGVILIPIIFLEVLDNLIEIGFKKFQKDPWFVREWQFGSSKYRFYYSDLGGMGQPARGELRREWDTPFGIKFTKSIWNTTYWCCAIDLKKSEGNSLQIIDKTGSKLTVVGEIDTKNDKASAKDEN